MKLAGFTKMFIRNYLIIFASIVICLTLLRQIFSSSSYFELTDIYIYMLCALVGNLPSLLFYSPKDISEKKMRFRFIIHFVVLEAVLLTFGNVLGLVNGALNTIIFASQIAVIYMIVQFLTFMNDKKETQRINEKLKKMKYESNVGSKEE
ncbi:hypothetical protein D3C74_229150 [compost metagenome]